MEFLAGKRGFFPYFLGSEIEFALSWPGSSWLKEHAEKLQNTEYKHIVQEWIHPSIHQGQHPKGLLVSTSTHSNPKDNLQLLWNPPPLILNNKSLK